MDRLRTYGLITTLPKCSSLELCGRVLPGDELGPGEVIFSIIFAYFNTSKHDSAPFKVSKTHALHPRAHHLNINTENNVAARAQVAKSALVVATLTARLVEHALALQAAEPDRFADARLRRETYTCNDRYVTAAGQVRQVRQPQGRRTGGYMPLLGNAGADYLPRCATAFRMTDARLGGPSGVRSGVLDPPPTDELLIDSPRVGRRT